MGALDSESPRFTQVRCLRLAARGPSSPCVKLTILLRLLEDDSKRWARFPAGLPSCLMSESGTSRPCLDNSCPQRPETGHAETDANDPFRKCLCGQKAVSEQESTAGVCPTSAELLNQLGNPIHDRPRRGV